MMQETKDVVVLIARVGNGIGKAIEDGKFGWEDLAAFGPAVAAVPAALAKCSDIPAELAAATDADREDLVNAFCTEFSIPQAAAEIAVEKSLAVAVAIWNMLK